MDIDLYSDPSCPWCWTASTWLRTVARERELAVRVRPFSLALLDKPAPPPVARARRWSLGALRVAVALDTPSSVQFLDNFACALFDGSGGADGPDLGDALERVGLPRELAAGADDESRDAQILSAMHEAAEQRGLPLDATTTVPILVMHTESGPMAVDGPLLDPAPDPARSAALWDDIAALLAVKEMYGVSRPRRGPHSSVAPLVVSVRSAS